jgi:hypothetical protein
MITYFQRYGLTACLAAVFLIPSFSFSQTIPDPKIQSPNAASFEKFGEIPVNLFTGTPDISIPIHTLSYGKIKVPVTLRYHPSSVKLVQHPGWVGLGWDLECAGTITRSVNQAMDELYAGTANGIQPYFPYNGQTSGSDNLQLSDWNTTSRMTQFFTSSNGTLTSDVQPDEFDFNFMGHSGKFYYQGSTLGWVVVSDENIKVQLNTSPNDFLTPAQVNSAIAEYPRNINFTFGDSPTQSRVFNSFTLTLADGTKYIFGGSEAIEFYSTYGITQYNGQVASHPIFTANTWLLKQIVDPDNNVVNFNYTRTYPNCDINLNYLNQSVSCQGVGSPSGSGYSNTTGAVDSKYSGNFHWPMYLSSVSSPNETISFSASVATCLRYTDAQFQNLKTTADGQYVSELLNNDFTNLQWEKLDNIVIRDNNQNVYRQFLFNYNNGGVLANQRLTLYSFSQLDAAASTVATYAFNYDNKNGKAISDLPLYDGNYTDHYGNFNNINIVGQNTSQALTLRQTDPSLVTTGLLNKITYPTGGTTQLTWEAHDYSQYLSTSRNSLNPAGTSPYAGGCRIADISNYLQDGSLATEKKYIYKRGYTHSSVLSSLASSGILNGLPQYVFDITQRPGFNAAFSVHLESINTLNSYGENGQGSYLGYDEVDEVNTDGSYSRNFFSSYGTDYNGVSHYDQQPSGMLGWVLTDNFLPYSSVERERGKLLAHLSYTPADILVAKETYTYRNDPGRFNSYLRMINHASNGTYSNIACGNGSIVFASANQVFTYSYYPVAKTMTVYDQLGNKPVTTSESYTYNGNSLISTLLSSKTSVNSRQETLVTNYLYPTDITNTSDPRYSISQQMAGANMLSPVIETSETNNGVQTSLTDVNYYSPSAGIYVPQNVQLQQGSYTKEVRQQFYAYDLFGDMQEESQANNAHNVYLWGYNHAFIVAQITNSTYAAVQQVMNQYGITQAQLDNGGALGDGQMRAYLTTIRTALPGSLVTGYTYAPLTGITSMTDPKGEIMFYEYDNFQRLMNIKDKDGNIVKNYCYNYAGGQTGCYINVVTYLSAAKSGIFAKSCGTGLTGSNVTYLVPQGRYTSKISQADADQQAQTDVNNNGQNYANTNGTCSVTILPFQVTNNSGLTGFVLTFSGTNNSNNISYSVPATGAANVSIPWGTYTLQVQPIGNYSNHTFTLGSRTPTVAPGFYMSGVSIITGSSDLSFKIQ